VKDLTIISFLTSVALLFTLPTDGFSLEYCLNGGFEIWTANDKPGCWWEAEYGASKVVPDSSDVHAGLYSCALHVDSQGNEAAVGQGKIGVEEGVYIVQFFAKVKFARPGTAIWFRIHDDGRNLIWDFQEGRWMADAPSMIVNLTDQWSMFCDTLEIDTVYTEIGFAIGTIRADSNNVIYIDEFKFIKLNSNVGKIKTKIGTTISVDMFMYKKFWRDSALTSYLRELNPSMIRIYIDYARPLIDYVPEDSDFVYNWARLDSAVDWITQNLNGVELMFTILFHTDLLPDGTPVIESLHYRTEIEQIAFDILPDWLIKKYCVNLCEHIIDKGWNVSWWQVYNEPNVCVGEDTTKFQLYMSSYNAAAEVIHNYFPEAKITVGNINNDLFRSYFLEHISGNYDPFVSVHKGGDGNRPDVDSSEILFYSHAWVSKPYMSPSGRQLQISNKLGKPNISIVFDEGSSVGGGGHPLNNTVFEIACTAQILKYSILLGAEYWLYFEFSHKYREPNRYPMLVDIDTKQPYPVYNFVKFIKTIMSENDSIIYVNAGNSDGLSKLAWLHGDQMWALVINMSPHTRNFYSSSQENGSGVVTIYSFNYNGIDSAEVLGQDTLVLTFNPYSVKVFRYNGALNLQEGWLNKGNFTSKGLYICKGFFSIKNFLLTNLVNIQVFNISGRKIKELQFQNKFPNRLDLSALPAGYYFIRFDYKNSSRVIKILELSP
jgi:hypothetical protein